MRRLVLVRHGESEWNRQRRVQGQSGSGLSDRGREQADAAASWLAEAYSVARLVSSDLDRCRETVAPVAAALGLEPVYDVEVRERRFGRWEGLTLTEIEEQDAELWRRWRDGEDVAREIGGETGDELAARASTALGRHVDAVDDGETVVVVTHGGIVWHGTHAVLGLDEPVLGGVGNTSVTVIGWNDRARWLDAWNQMGHLPVGLRTTFRPSRSGRKAPPVGR